MARLGGKDVRSQTLIERQPSIHPLDQTFSDDYGGKFNAKKRPGPLRDNYVLKRGSEIPIY